MTASMLAVAQNAAPEAAAPAPARPGLVAGFEVDELRGALARIRRTIPNYRNINVDTAVAAIFADKLKAVDAAVKASDPAQFNTGYGEMTAAYNDCHKGMEHPFLVIKVPEAGNFPDQEFRP